MKYVTVFDEIACLVNQIAKNSESNHYRIAQYLNRIALCSNRIAIESNSDLILPITVSTIGITVSGVNKQVLEKTCVN